MNINNVYECTVLRVIDRKRYEDDSVEFTYALAKKALVYQEKLDSWYWTDLSTKEKYHNDLSLVFAFTGDLYVPGKSLVPISSIIESKRDNMTKGKILRKYKEHNSKVGKNNEYK